MQNVLTPQNIVDAANNTFTLPDICLKLRDMLSDPTNSLDRVAELLSTDPVLSGKLLKLANSALFRFSQQIETVSKAINVLGGEATFNIVMADAASCACDAFASDKLDPDTYWEHALLRGILAKEIAKQHKVRGSERFFVLGILSHLSELVVAHNFSTTYERYVTTLVSSNVQLTPWLAQIETMGFSFCQVSGEMCRQWLLPMSLYSPLCNAFAPQIIDAGKTPDRDTRIIQLACRITSAYVNEKLVSDIDLGAEQSTWLGDESSLIDMLDYACKEAVRLQAVFK